MFLSLDLLKKHFYYVKGFVGFPQRDKGKERTYFQAYFGLAVNNASGLVGEGGMSTVKVV